MRTQERDEREKNVTYAGEPEGGRLMPLKGKSDFGILMQERPPRCGGPITRNHKHKSQHKMYRHMSPPLQMAWAFFHPMVGLAEQSPSSHFNYKVARLFIDMRQSLAIRAHPCPLAEL